MLGARSRGGCCHAAKSRSGANLEQASFARVQEHAATLTDLGRATSRHRAPTLQRDHRITIRARVPAQWKNRVDPLARANAVVASEQRTRHFRCVILATSLELAELSFDRGAVRIQ